MIALTKSFAVPEIFAELRCFGPARKADVAYLWNCPCREVFSAPGLERAARIWVAGEERDDVRAEKFWLFPVYDGPPAVS